MATKHNQIIQYIESLPVGEKISVRSIAKNLKMSEGTAYRAIKDAEVIGLVSTIERVGTIRIERKAKNNFEILTFGEIVKIIEGEVYGGEAGLDKVLKRFVIGAMTVDAMERYIQPESLMIIGNRIEAQKLALENGAAVLITGGFKASEDLVRLANELEIPILGTTYDTFTVATMINRAMTDQLIKKKIMLVEDIYTKIDKTQYLYSAGTVADYRNLNEKSGHSCFPVMNHSGRLIGMVSAKDVIGKTDQISLERVITKNPSVTKMHTSVASVAHQMIWNGLEMLPVVRDNMELVGIVTRPDVMKAMQLLQRQPQVGNTLEDEIAQNIISQEDGLQPYKFVVTPQMTNSLGMLSFGALCEVISVTCKSYVIKTHKQNMVIEQLSLHYYKMIQVDSEIEIKIESLDVGRKNIKLEVTILVENIVVGKALLSAQLMERS
ncbi:Predicted transcriptional regulator containing CBS domains [Granulicatella balaenopterae]|uniref:Predicted transcriptional regulator containing CBS domains n=1 Tax=Granulicatella balaenopterae TaxID=137733 RepID=A0A1H9K7W0_9LACT|nr:DRTGG domain-containing protein [Granulicatella balaenopterae]SEQ95017.1 Predicted transcriptional regulator containing CBS domains [Granulicatella balaenopterae]